MLRALTSEQARTVERCATGDSAVTVGSLMAAAGRALARELVERVADGPVVILAGPGNNGGDGWVAAQELRALSRDVRVMSLCDPASLQGIAAEAASRAVAAGVSFTVPSESLNAAELDDTVVIDALLGTGARLPLEERIAGWCAAVNRSNAYVLAADVPTGVSSDTGECAAEAVRADCTVTFTAPKLGLVTFPGAACAGEVVVADIGIASEFADLDGAPEVWAAEEYGSLVPMPAPDAHKNSRGRVLVVAGSRLFAGAAVLAARGAMRAGAGYVTVAVPESIVSVVQSHLVAAPVVGLPASRTGTFTSAAGTAAADLARDYDAVVMGPGLTLSDGAVATARRVFAGVAKPLVVDADGLNALVDATGLLDSRTAPTVLTPHPGELARLLGMSTEGVQADRVSSAARIARADLAVVLKGAGTVVSTGERCVINTSGSPGLATAGTGDVLAGVVGALLARGMSAFEAAALGAYVHGRAGEVAASELTPLCVTAEDVPGYLPAAFGEILQGW